MANAQAPNWKSDMKWAIGLLFFAMLALTAWTNASWACPVGPGQDASTANACVAQRGEGPPVTENLAQITETILTDGEAQSTEGMSHGSDGQVVALQTLAVLLVAALIGSLVIAIREPETEGGSL